MNKFQILVINTLEQAILDDKLYQISLCVGRERKGHPEGQLGNHVNQILAHLKKKCASKPQYDQLRIVAFLHDMGKLGDITSADSKFIPLSDTGSEPSHEERRHYLGAALHLRNSYGSEVKDEYIPRHAMCSFEFAKAKFSQDWKEQIANLNWSGEDISNVLDIIQLHDCGWRFFKEANRKPNYNTKRFTEIFSGKQDCWYEMLFKFMEADNNQRENTTQLWLQRELKNQRIIDKEYV